jgi:hypothetical protein
MVEQIRSSPMFEGLVALAQSTVYDAALTRQVSTPTTGMREVDAPVVILCGTDTFPFLRAAAARLGRELPGAELVDVPESVQHRLDPAATARILTARLRP